MVRNQYRLTQRRLERKLAEANELMERLESKGQQPLAFLRTVKGRPLGRRFAIMKHGR